MNKSTRKNSVFILSCLLSGATLLLACLLRQFSKDKDNRGVSAFVDVNGFE